MDRIKARMRRIVKTWLLRPLNCDWALGRKVPLADDPEFIGKLAAVHGRPCSCDGCRWHKDVPPPRERGRGDVAEG